VHSHAAMDGRVGASACMQSRRQCAANEFMLQCASRCIALARLVVDLVEANPALRRVPLAEAERYAASINARVLEASAKSGDSIVHIFEQVVAAYFDRADAASGVNKQSTQTQNGQAKSANLAATQAGERKKCC
jgi:hypothetical protein